ncbi:MAG: hypothetical protein ACLR1V_08615 [Coprococcus sp.]
MAGREQAVTRLKSSISRQWAYSKAAFDWSDSQTPLVRQSYSDQPGGRPSGMT